MTESVRALAKGQEAESGKSKAEGSESLAGKTKPFPVHSRGRPERP